MITDLPPSPPSRVTHVVATPPLMLGIQAAVHDTIQVLITTGFLTVHQGSAARFYPALREATVKDMPQYHGMKIPNDQQRTEMEQELSDYAVAMPKNIMKFLEDQEKAGNVSFTAGKKENVRNIIDGACKEILQRQQERRATPD